MRYHGGKSRSGKRIAEVIKNVIGKDSSITGYCEPFCGACGVLRHVTSVEGLTYLAGDTNESIILMWQELCKGWVPTISDITREKYLTLKGNGLSSAEKGFIGHVVSFGGLYFKTFTDSLIERLPGSRKSVISISKDLINVEFSAGDYKQFSSLKNFIIFCDPPYENTQSRYYDENNNIRKFDTEEFWRWCSIMRRHNTIIVNEMSGSSNEHEWKSVQLPPRDIRYKGHVYKSDETLYIQNKEDG